jgi:pyruvate,orthophosphate dikinase
MLSFGSKGEAFPLLLSVRSGARVSMPGMMNTVLNLGMNDDAVKVLLKNRVMSVLLGILTVVLSKCMVMLLWALKAEKGHHDPFEVVMDKVKEARKDIN